MKEIQFLIFDMGNTLLDFHSGKHTDDEKDQMGLANMQKYLLENHNINISVRDLDDGFFKLWINDFHIRKQGVELDVEVYLKQFFDELNLVHAEVDYYQLMKCFYKPYLEEVKINDNALKIVNELSRIYKIGVISNCILYDEIYVELFEQLGFDIDEYIFSYNRGFRKPNERLFVEMFEKLGVKPEYGMMIGDNINADLLPAKELGMVTVLYKKEFKGSHFVDHRIENFFELKGILEKHDY